MKKALIGIVQWHAVTDGNKSGICDIDKSNEQHNANIFPEYENDGKFRPRIMKEHSFPITNKIEMQMSVVMIALVSNSVMPMQNAHKEKKYDRQLRVWEEEGQSLLENSHVCLIGANTVGCEVLKNLILPGIGKVTVVDDKLVTQMDVDSNYFIHADNIGLNRFEAVAMKLKNLNDDIAIQTVHASLQTLIENQTFWQQFSMVICAEANSIDTDLLSNILWNLNIPLMLIRNIGFIGFFRISTPEHVVRNAKSESVGIDLRLNNPFSELSMFANKFDLAFVESDVHSHVPYVVILLKALTIWRDQGRSHLPSTTVEKDQFKSIIDSMARSSDELNFIEARNNAYRIWSPLPPINLNCKPKDPRLSALLDAVHQFVEQKGQLPLNGDIPDMESDSLTFIELSRIYKSRALEDAAIIYRICSVHCPDISLEVVIHFCKLIRQFRIINYPQLKITQHLAGNAILAVLEAAAMFSAKHERYPNVSSIDELMEFIPLEYRSTVHRELANEVCLHGGCQYNSVASQLGSLASQECIKMITGQYVPVEDTLVLNALGQFETHCISHLR